ncbi:VanW family protein [Clostridium sp. Ade.TY]|uniref:VanW family protein n=1 Tax=Clostridium sp. Ade.TY TaxID=1391647 RepID=UPI000410F80D|nr:VanW family protein [Clostridium sp. Ade.TY]
MSSSGDESLSKKGDSKKKIIIGITALASMMIIGGIAYGVSANNAINEWSNKIYPNVFIKEINVGGMTKEEAKNALNNNYTKNIGNKEIIVNIKGKDKEFEANYSEISPKYDVDKAIDEAFNYGKDSNFFKKNSLIKNKKNYKQEIQLNFTYNNKKLTSLEDKIVKKFTILPKDATISINGKILITPEKVGYGVDKKELDNKFKEELNGDIGNETKIVVEEKEVMPKVTKKELSKIDGVMGEFTTSYQSSDSNRATNIQVVTNFVDGTVLMPGEEFSYSETSQKDKSLYKEGNAYINNQVVKDIGGGICQVSTTLYRAVMKANIRSTERYNHSLTVGYSKPGLDATVAWGYLDYKFKNPYDFPIYIKGITHNKMVTFKIYGDVDGLKGRTYDMTNEVLRVINPTEEIIKDPNLEEGKRIVESNGQTGYVARGYQLTYENGQLIKKELVSTDNYAMVPRKVRVGTKKK